MDPDDQSPVKYVFEGPLDEEQLDSFLKVAFGISIPKKAVCEHHCAPWDAFTFGYYAKGGIGVIKGSRGLAGKSFLLGVLQSAEAVMLGAHSNVLGGSAQQSQRVIEVQTELWTYKSAPRHMLETEPSKSYVRYQNGAKTKALTASQTSARGSHPQRLRLDEVDEMDIKIMDAALGQPMDGRGVLSNTMISSTHQNPNGTMTEVLKRAAKKGWPVFEWCYKECLIENGGWLTPEQVEKTRGTVSELMWSVEYELQEPSAENRAFDSDCVRAMFSKERGVYDAPLGKEVTILEPAKDDEGNLVGWYASGADWARKVDDTVLVTLKVEQDPMLLAAFQRMKRLPWPEMVGRFDERILKYQGVAAHDATGLGDVVDGYLIGDVEPVILVGRQRKDLFSEYIRAVEAGEIEAPFIQSVYDDHLYCTYDDLFGTGHPPDSVVAMALAYHAGKDGGVGIS